jgi:hypothetical protein
MDIAQLTTSVLLYADVVWPALLLEQKLLGIVPISVGLIIEWLVLWLGFALPLRKAAVIGASMNVFSMLVGILFIPVLGLGWDVLLGSLLYSVFNVPGTWIPASLMAVLVNTTVETGVVKWGFKVPLSRRRVSLLCAANCASVAIAFVSLWLRPPSG